MAQNSLFNEAGFYLCVGLYAAPKGRLEGEVNVSAYVINTLLPHVCVKVKDELFVEQV